MTGSYYSTFFNIHQSGVLTALSDHCMAGAMWNCCRLSASSVYTTRPQCHFIQSHRGRVHVCLAVTCHLHVWQNDWDCFCATAVTHGWNGYQNKCQHRKLTMEKIIFPLLPRRLKPRTFQSRVQCSNHWAIPTHPCTPPSLNTVITLNRFSQCAVTHFAPDCPFFFQTMWPRTAQLQPVSRHSILASRLMQIRMGFSQDL